MLERVVSGGQAGADQAGWRAARAAGIATGGWMPAGFQTEEGPRPGFALEFGAVEHESPDPSARTVANVRDSDATLVFAGDRPSPGTLLTIEACREAGVPCLVIHPDRPSGESSPARVAEWIAAVRPRTLNLAGDRESHAPGLGERVEGYLAELFGLLAPPQEAGRDEGPMR